MLSDAQEYTDKQPWAIEYYTRPDKVNNFTARFWHDNELYLTLGGRIYKTSDYGKTLAPYVYEFSNGSIAAFIKTKLGAFLCIRRTSTTQLTVSRSINLTDWTDVLTLTNKTGPMINDLGWDSNENGVVLLGEYTTDTTIDKTAINLYVSIDDGITWNVGKSWPTNGEGKIKHIHCVRWDEYSEVFWVASGDAKTDSFLATTTDGVNLTTQLTNDDSLTAVSLAFNKRYVLWGKDLQTANDFTIHMLNKVTLEVTTVGYINNVCYYILKHPNGYILFDQAENAPERGVHSNSAYIYWSMDGTNWKRIYEVPLNVGDVHYFQQPLISPCGKYLTICQTYTLNGGSQQRVFQTLKLPFV